MDLKKCFYNRRILFLALSIFCLGVYMCLYHFANEHDKNVQSIQQRQELELRPLSLEDRKSEWHKQFGDTEEWNRNRACKIPRIYPFDPKVLDIFENELNRRKTFKPVPCLKDPPRFKTDLNSTLIRNYTNLKFWKTTSCCYTPYAKGNHWNVVFEESVDGAETCYPITEEYTYIKEAYTNIRVTCFSSKSAATEPVYRDYFQFFRINKTLEVNAQKKESISRATGNDHLSIIYLGLDTVALTNFQRLVPKTRDYLVNEMGAIEFIGMNKIGQATLENMIPYFSGCEFEDENTHFPSETEDCHLVFEKYSSKGYRTILSKDEVWVSLFKYVHHKWDSVSNVRNVMDYDNLVYISGLQSTCESARFTFGCFEHQFAPRHLKERILEVAQKFNGKLYFHYVWDVLTGHDIIGAPKYFEEPLMELMQALKHDQLLNDTLLIVGSDHGKASADYSVTPDGIIESRMPFIYFVFPEWFKKKYTSALANLKINSQGLATPFDMHQTLIDLTDLSQITNEGLANRSVEEKSGQKGLSLFLPIPLSRTCSSAHVPRQYCICLSWSHVNEPQEDISVLRAVNFTIARMNQVISAYPQCSQLELEKVIDGKRTKDGQGNSLYEVIFQVIPSHGIFGAALKVEKWTWWFLGSAIEFSLAGEVERQNMYFNESICLGKEKLDAGWIRSACYCK